MKDEKWLETKQFLCEHAALVCELHSLCARVSAMEAENKIRNAFNGDDFLAVGDRMLYIADRFRKLV